MPRSMMRPPSMTMMQSLLRTVESRWAMTKVVRPCIRASMAFCTWDSVRVSMEEVASSRIITASVADVLHDRSGEEHAVLEHHAEGGTKSRLLDLLDVDAVVADLALGDVVKPVEQVGDGGLARAGGADESDLFTRIPVERHVVEDRFLSVVGEGHVVESDQTAHGFVGERAVVMGVLPRPFAGVLRGLGERAVGVLRDVHQSDIAFVGFGLLVHHAEDTGSAGHGHGYGVDLLGDLGDGAGEVPVQAQEGDEHAERQRAAPPAEDERAAEHSHEHISDVADAAVDGHQNAGINVRLGGAVAKLLVEFLEFLNGVLFMTEHLDDLLTFQGLLDKGVRTAQGRLTFEEVFPRKTAQLARGEQLHADHHEREQRQRDAQADHAGQRHRDGEARFKDLRQRLTDDLTGGVDIVGEHGHDVAALMGIKVANGQGLHFAEQLVAHFFERALSDDGHNDAAQITRHDADQINDRQRSQRARQRGEVRVGRAEHGENINIDELLHEQRSLQMGIGVNPDQHGHEQQREGVISENVFEDAKQRPLIQRAGRVAPSSSSGSHNPIPPLSYASGSSKSPPPLVCVS